MSGASWHSEARKMRAEGASVTSIAALFGVSVPRVSQVCNPAYEARQRVYARDWGRSHRQKLKAKRQSEDSAL